MSADFSRSVSFIVPCHNEEAALAATIAQIRAAAESHQAPYEIVLVDDGSSDRTGEIANGFAAADPRIRSLHNGVNLGYGGAYKRGVAAARMERVMLIPGDDGIPAASIAHILSKVGEADIVIPYPTNSEIRTPLRSLLSVWYTRILNSIFRQNIRYYNGTTVHKRVLLCSIDLSSNRFAFQAEAVIKLLGRGCSYVECPIEIRERVAGASSALKPRNIWDVLATTARLIWHVALPRCRASHNRDIGPVKS